MNTNIQTNFSYEREKVRTNLYKVTYYSKELGEHKEIRVRSWKVLDKDTVEEFIRDSFQELYSNTYGYDCSDYEETFDFYEELDVDLIDDDENQFNITYLKVSIDPELGTLIYNK